jgi:hypothetical protein
MTERKIIAFTNYRDRKEPYDYSKLVPSMKEMVGFFTTHQPGEWCRDENSRRIFETIWPGALTKLDHTSLVPENVEPQWVIGTLVGDNTIDKAKAEGRLFGCDPIYAPEEDHTGMIEISMPFGGMTKWVKASEVRFANLTAEEALSAIRKVIREELNLMK